MFLKAVKLDFKEGTRLELTFQTGEIKPYDMKNLFVKYPRLEALKNRRLFTSGKLMGAYGIYWNDELDVGVETIYEDGIMIGKSETTFNIVIANMLVSARASVGISQLELSKRTGIDQSDISKLERGIGNPSINTLNRLASALGKELTIKFEQ